MFNISEKQYTFALQIEVFLDPYWAMNVLCSWRNYNKNFGRFGIPVQFYDGIALWPTRWQEEEEEEEVGEEKNSTN